MAKGRKVISTVAALTIAASLAPTVNAKNYYKDEDGNKIYEDHIVDNNGNVLYDGYYIDEDGNAIIVEKMPTIYDDYDYDYDYDYDNNYYNRYNDSNTHINIDISDPEVYNRYLKDHKKHCNDYQCKHNRADIINHGQNGYNNNYDNNYNYNDYNKNNNLENKYLYTVVKTQDGVTKYAYSPVANVADYGIYGWTLNSIYNENDLELNSVFYEEINTFNNDYRWDGRIVNMINNSHNMYVWVYYTNEGPKYCVSPVKFPSNSDFVYNSDYNINDVTEALKTNTAAAKDLYYTRTR